MAVSAVGDWTLTPVAFMAPNITVVAPWTKFDPVSVTMVPPVAGPLVGEMVETVGGARVSRPKAVPQLQLSVAAAEYSSAWPRVGVWGGASAAEKYSTHRI